jgi:hypothetical protein
METVNFEHTIPGLVFHRSPIAVAESFASRIFSNPQYTRKRHLRPLE